MKSKLRKLYYRGRSNIVSRFLSYDADKLSNAIHNLGVSSGDTLMVHSSFRPDNGFRGGYKDIVQVLKNIVTEDGLLVMLSMPYTDSSRAFLQRGKPMNVRRTPSSMGLISEIFRRNKEVKRSLNPIHPLLAWGKEAESFLADHEQCKHSFGSGSPFEKLLHRNAKILCFDVGFEFITFTHFVEDQVKDNFSFPLYDSSPLAGTTIDYEENSITVDCYVLSDTSRELRKEEKLIAELKQQKLLHETRIGNTHLLLIDCRDILTTAQNMLANGRSFFDSV